MAKKKRIVIALGRNALGNTLPEQMKAVKITAEAIADLVEEGCEVAAAHGNGSQAGMVNDAMTALTYEDENQPNTPLVRLCGYEPGLYWIRPAKCPVGRTAEPND